MDNLIPFFLFILISLVYSSLFLLPPDFLIHLYKHWQPVGMTWSVSPMHLLQGSHNHIEIHLLLLLILPNGVTEYTLVCVSTPARSGGPCFLTRPHDSLPRETQQLTTLPLLLGTACSLSSCSRQGYSEQPEQPTLPSGTLTPVDWFLYLLIQRRKPSCMLGSGFVRSHRARECQQHFSQVHWVPYCMLFSPLDRAFF